ncbi:MAG: excinuclease ABC subunit UvrC [candidate division WOR-3 bacterium]
MDLAEKIKEAPTQPGVYIFKDKQGKAIYIGKARNLRERLKSYLSPPLSPRMETIQRKAYDLDFIVTDSEVSALVLEDNLIKINKPRYNVRLKDDKKFPYLKITIKEQYPRIYPTRNLKPDGSILFGPYTSARSLKTALKAVKKVFKIRTCAKKIPSGERPCLNYQLHRCLAPCQGNIPEDFYRERTEEVIAFLTGKSDRLEKEIEKKMWEAAEKENFERAQVLRDQLFALREIRKNQTVVSKDRKRRDFIGIAQEGETACAVIFKVSEGKLADKEEYIFTLPKETPKEEIIETILRSTYTHTYDLPSEIIIPFPIPEPQTFQAFILEKRGRLIKIKVAKKGENRKLLKLAEENALIKLKESLPKKRIPHPNQELAKYLNLPKIPLRIEGVDISNISGKYATGSIVVFLGNEPKKDEYRKFRIKTLSSPNDYGMMEEVLRRRVKRIIEEKRELPDLVLVDGGKGQLGVAKRVYSEVDDKIPVLAFAKRTDTLYLPDGQEVSIPAYSPALKLLKRIRDAAHNFAITYHKKLRSKAVKKSILDEIPGIGEKRKKELLLYFGSIERLKSASIEDIKKVKGIGETFAAKIYEYLHR